MGKKKKGLLTNRQRREQMPELVDTRAAHRKAAIAAGTNDGRYRTRCGGGDKRHEIRNKDQRRAGNGY